MYKYIYIYICVCVYSKQKHVVLVIETYIVSGCLGSFKLVLACLKRRIKPSAVASDP